MKKAKLIWTKRGYRVEFCRWKGYTPSTWKPYLVHDLFEHRPEDTGTVLDEIRAVGAKLRFDGVYTYFDKDGKHYFENRKRYKRKKHDSFVIYHKKGEHGLKSLAKLYARNCGHYQTALKLLREGYNHAQKFSQEAYNRAWTIDFKRYHKQNVHLEISLLTGRVLKKIPKPIDKYN